MSRFRQSVPLLIALALLLARPIAVRGAQQEQGSVTVLHYRCYADPWSEIASTPLETFRRHMDFLQAEGYHVAPITAVRRMLTSDLAIPDSAVVVTVEGSARSIYDQVYPILKGLGFPFVLFPHIRALDSAGSVDCLTWPQVEELHAAGVEVGNLTYGNESLAVPRHDESSEWHRIRVREEILNAHRALLLHGIATDLLAFPHGDYAPVVVSEGLSLGYRLMFTHDRGKLDRRTALEFIPRYSVASDVSTDRLAFELSLAPLAVSDITPAAGRVLENPPPVFSLRIQKPGQYLPGVVNMFISELGRVEARYDPVTGRTVWNPEAPFRLARNRMTVTAKERESGRYAIYSRLFFTPTTPEPSDELP